MWLFFCQNTLTCNFIYTECYSKCWMRGPFRVFGVFVNAKGKQVNTTIYAACLYQHEEKILTNGRGSAEDWIMRLAGLVAPPAIFLYKRLSIWCSRSSLFMSKRPIPSEVIRHCCDSSTQVQNLLWNHLIRSRTIEICDMSLRTSYDTSGNCT